MKKVAILTLGCKVNQYESACIASGFQTEGYELVEFEEKADVYVINTCTVTNRTDYKSRNAIRKALDQKLVNPDIRIVVTGCFSQRHYQQVKELGDIDLWDRLSGSSIWDEPVLGLEGRLLTPEEQLENLNRISPCCSRLQRLAGSLDGLFGEGEIKKTDRRTHHA